LDGLRFALIVLGIVVVAAVYFWTARRRRLEREAGDFDRFDAWTDDDLDPLSPSAAARSSSHGDDRDVFEDADDNSDDLTQRNFRLPANSTSLARNGSHEVADAESVAPLEPAADAEISADYHPGNDAEPALREQRSAPAPGVADTASGVAEDAPPEAIVALDEGEVIEDLEAIANSLDVRAEPSLGALDDMEFNDSPSTRSVSPSAPRKESASAEGLEPGNTDARTSSERKSEDAAAPEMVVVLNVMARAEQTFDGLSLQAALEGAGLKSGDMQLYHYRAETQSEDTPPIFSALNAVRPGTLDVSEFDGMHTPGIALVLRVPGLERPSESFELMLVAARRIAAELDGQVCDDTRSTLTGQALNHMRERIAAVAFRARPGG